MSASLSYSSKGSRQTNQDYFLSTAFDEEHSIFIVADGIGGFEHGEIASEISATSVITKGIQMELIRSPKYLRYQTFHKFPL